MPIRFKVRRMFAQSMRRFLRSRRGNIAALTALLIIPLAALMGMATEGGSWFLIQRAAQNAADSAAIAAATNGGNGGTDFVTEAKMVTSKYGFTDGGDTTITVPNPVTTYSSVSSCASSPCYRVTVSRNVPLHLLQVVGYSGNATVNGGAAQSVTATALATTKIVSVPACLLALGSGNAINGSGLNHSTITCNIMSNGDAGYCNGTNGLTSGWSDFASDSGPQSSQHSCSEDPKRQRKASSAISDPYQKVLSDNPPTNPCSNYYPSTNSKWPSTTNNISGTPGWDGTEKVFCGDVKLSGNVTLSGKSTVLVIENGQLDLNGKTLSTASGGGLTVIFTTPGTNAYTSGGTPANFVVDSKSKGVLNIAAPTSGTWSGLAIAQKTGLPLQSMTYTGSSPEFDITGVIDAPALNLTARGAIGPSKYGYSCFTLVVNSLSISGTGNLFYQGAQSQCPQAGVTTIQIPGGVIGQLVY